MELIDRKLRQRYLPFLVKKSGIQRWSFRPLENADMTLGIMPDDHQMFDKDISLQQLYGLESDGCVVGRAIAGGSKTNLTLQHILQLIPSIEIREYTQDTRLDTILSFVDFIKQGIKDGGAVATKLETKKGSQSAFMELVSYDIKNMKVSDLFQAVLESFESISKPFDMGIMKRTDYEHDVIVDMCYAMYYRMITSSTTNIYRIPFNSSHVMTGNGEVGFELSQMGLDNLVGGGKSGILGQLINFISPNINVSLTPLWHGMKGGNGVNIDLTLNLFNDTKEHAVANFVFVNTIMPQNLPTQYGILQQPPSLYDIRISGGNRLFMCSGNFQCNYKGVMRYMSDAMLEGEGGLKKYVNKDIGMDIDKINAYEMLKVPDVYEIKMSFKSLLPNVFNNYLFQFVLNDNMKNYEEDNSKGLVGILEDTTVTGKIDSWLNKRADDAITLAEKYDEAKVQYDAKKAAIQSDKDLETEVMNGALSDIEKEYQEAKQQALIDIVYADEEAEATAEEDQENQQDETDEGEESEEETEEESEEDSDEPISELEEPYEESSENSDSTEEDDAAKAAEESEEAWREADPDADDGQQEQSEQGNDEPDVDEEQVKEPEKESEKTDWNVPDNEDIPDMYK